MPPKLSRYVMREVLQMYGIGVLLFVILQMTDYLSGTVGKAMQYHMSLGAAVGAFLGKLPEILNKSIVVAVPFAILLGLSRMQKDSEVKAMLACGVRPMSLVWPLLLPFAAVGALAFYNSGVVVPAGLQKWERTWLQTFGMTTPIPSQDKYTYSPAGSLYYAGRVTSDPGGQSAQLWGPTVQRGDETITAQTGTWNAVQKTWVLNDPWITRPGENPVQQMGPLTFPQDDSLQPPPPDPKKVSTAQLRAELRKPNLTREVRRDYQYQYAARHADPFTPIAFALAAGALGLLLRNRVAAIAAVIVFIAVFYVLWWGVLPQVAKSGAMDPTLAAWIPSLLYLLLGLGLAWRLR